MGLVFQDPERGFFEETVIEEVSFGPRNAGHSAEEARALAVRALETVGLDAKELGSRAPETLSGGEARRVAIAGVLAFRPSLVIFDEPTSGLDAEGMDRLRDLLANLRAGGSAYLVISHELTFLAEECDRILLLEEGRLIWEGSPANLAEHLPSEWRERPETWGGELVLLARRMRERGWIDESVPPTPDALATAWTAHAGGARES